MMSRTSDSYQHFRDGQRNLRDDIDFSFSNLSYDLSFTACDIRGVA
jgi:hypothetical protein